MNLARALDVALPELPARQISQSRPKLHPKVVAREHTVDGKTEVSVLMPGKGLYFRFSPEEWNLVQLFNGERTYEEISAIAAEELRMDVPVDMLQGFVASNDFWYKSPAEQHLEYAKRVEEQRGNKSKKPGGEGGDLSMIELIYWDPDVFFTKFHEKVRWVYSRWFTLLTLCLFAFMGYVFVDRWAEIGHDTFEYYNFTTKTGWDVLEFYILFGVLAALHESAHGLTCKHFGGGVHKMGMLLIFLSPAFFVDVVEAWVYASKWQRVMTMLAGLWVELILCGLMTIVWWGTPPGTFTHELAYKFMLIGGIAVIIINMNPLIKMDGYHIFSEIIGMPDLKEASTAYVSSWVRKYIFFLPVQVELISRRKQIFFLVYGALSGLYAYTLLFVVVTFAYNIFYSFSPEWAVVPASLLTYKIFKSRALNVVRLMKTVYIDRKARWAAALRRPPVAAVAAATLVFVLFAPLWRESVEGRFVLEAQSRAVLRAEVPGKVDAVYVREGQAVQAGQRLALMHNLQIDSDAQHAGQDYRESASRLVQASAQYSNGTAAALQTSRELDIKNRMLQAQQQRLSISSPIQGVVSTALPEDKVGAWLSSGDEILTIADLSNLRARIFLPDAYLRKVHLGSSVSLHLDGVFTAARSKVSSISPVTAEVAPGLMPAVTYKGVNGISFYSVSADLSNANGALRDGMTGTARIFGPRRSATGFALSAIRDFASRKLW